MPQQHFLDNRLVLSRSNFLSRPSEMTALELTCLLKPRRTRCRASPRSFRKVMSCSQREVVTGNPAAKEATVSLGCLV
jgi:hypothetical protein